MVRTIASLAMALLLTPLAASALTLEELRVQLQSLQAQIAVLTSQSATTQGSVLGVASWCPTLTRTLSYSARLASRGADVTQLQRWLIEEGYLAAGNSTGFFGLVTEKAVKDFQCKEGIVCSGTVATTGYGAVGPATRAKIAQVCVSQPTPTPLPPAPTPIVPAPTPPTPPTPPVPPVLPIPIPPVPPTPPVISWGTQTGEVIERYYPFNVQHGALLVSQSNFNENASQWANRSVSTTRIDITWGTPGNWPGPDSSTEEFEIRSNCAGGKRMMYLNAFTNENAGQRYPIETRKAEIKIGNGPWIDITSGGSCGTNGQPYAFADLISEPYTMRLWGNIYGVDGKIGRTFFWQHTISHDASSLNSCWQNDAMTSRQAMVQEEAWWDSANGWMNSGPNTGSGSMGTNGEPDGNTLNYVRGQKIGKDVGLGWTTFGGINYCMKYMWSW